MDSLVRVCLLRGLVATILLSAPAGAQTATGPNDDTVLRQIVIFGRHSVRAPLLPPADLAKFAAKPFPDFGVPAGYLTPHGQQAEVLLGSYFREYLLHEGLLTGLSQWDAFRSYFRANSIQRSNITAAAFGAGLLPGTTIPVHSYALGQPDPVFDPVQTKVAAVDPARVAAEAQAIYNSGAALASAYSGELALIRSVLLDYPEGTTPPASTPPGVVDPIALPILLTPSTTDIATGHVVNLGGLVPAVIASDPFIMEYANGMPLSDVAWGRLSPDALSRQSRVGQLNLEIETRLPYLRRVQSSNAASHVLRTLEQGVFSGTIRGAFGSGRSRVHVIISSDTFVLGLAGLLDLHWLLPGYQPDLCPPGGALVFELRQSRTTGQHVVRVFFTAQTLDQLRSLTPLTLDQPPATVQLLVPGARQAGAGLDVTFEGFQRLARRAIDPECVQDTALEVPPGVLTGVPLQ